MVSLIASPDCTVSTLEARDCPLEARVDTLPSPRWRCCMAPTTVGVGVHTHITSAGVHDLVALVRDLVALVVHPWHVMSSTGELRSDYMQRERDSATT